MSETSRVRARRLLLCATGGFECYALPGFVLKLLRHVADDVQVVLSRAAARLVSTHAVEAASRNPVYTEMEDTGPGVFVPHIELSRSADLILVYPATVNVLGKVAAGITDELVPALILAAEIPVFFVPISHPAMTGHPSVRRNIRQLREDGYVVLPPLPNVEVATREGLEEIQDLFPLPTLLAQMGSVLSGKTRLGIPAREQD
jgi:phosphopantothenoylcysteine decarboxylase/phosphopantothenate--cysteine ligase